MATYAEIQSYVKKKYGYTVKTCWIAHVKELNGLPVRQAPNRYSPYKRLHPCPSSKRDAIEDAMKHLGML